MGMDKKMLTTNPMEKQITIMNTASDNIKYPVDNKTFLCQHKKIYPITTRRVK